MIQAIKAFKDNYIWVFTIDNNKIACVDPGDAAPILAYCQANKLTLDVVLLTHHHADHIGGVNGLQRYFPDLKVYGPTDQRIPVNHSLVSSLTLNDYAFQIIPTPGHTSTHICYFEPTLKWLFCGDTLFSAGCGRVFDGTMEQLFESLQKLRALPDDTLVYCAHEYTLQNLRFAHSIEPDNLEVQNYINKLSQHERCTIPSTIGYEKKINPFFHFDQPEIANFIKCHGLNPQNHFEVFQAIRLTKDKF